MVDSFNFHKGDMMYPEYLQHDINQWIKAKEENNPSWDLYWDELYGSINSAWADGEISFSVAAELRQKYLGI